MVASQTPGNKSADLRLATTDVNIATIGLVFRQDFVVLDRGFLLSTQWEASGNVSLCLKMLGLLPHY